jgi:DNA-binding CsgD family transcriptional regulator
MGHEERKRVSPTASELSSTSSRSGTQTRRSQAKLYISVRTAETHRAHIMQKLRINTRAELVRYALEQGLLEAEGD